MPQHALRDLEVGDHAVTQGTHDFDQLRHPAFHLARRLTDLDDLQLLDVNGDDRRLVQDDFVPFAHQGVVRPEVDPQTASEECHTSQPSLSPERCRAPGVRR